MGRSRVICWIVVLVASWVAGAAYGKEFPKANQPVRLLVKPRPEALATRNRELARAHTALGGHLHRRHPRLRNLEVIELPPGTDVGSALDVYKSTGLFEYVEPDHEIHAFATPDDPYFVDGTLWALRNFGQDGGVSNADIDATAAWDIRRSAASVIVAVVDSGIRYTHEDLAANMWVNHGEIPGNGIDDDGDGIVDDVHGFNALAPANSPAAGDPWDDFGHGTHVSGIIGAVGNNGIGVVGVAWRVQLMACKFIDRSGSGQLSDALACIDYAVAHGARVINASWGCEGCNSEALRDAIAAAGEAGTVFVAAAGNSAENVDETAVYPADYDLDNLVAVAATDRTDQLAGFSNFGRQHVGLGAPGMDILSTFKRSDGDYFRLSGTSMAAPHVSGALALLAARFPHETLRNLVGRLLGNVDPLPGLAGMSVSGGRLNLYKALTQRPNPVVRLDAGTHGGEPPLTVTFSNQSLNAQWFLWDFGDGRRPSHLRKPTHTFSNFGTYTVTLTAWGRGDRMNSASQIITVAPNYQMLPGNFFWVNPGRMKSVGLSDDDVSGPQPLPFPFTFYGQTYSNVYLGSNGMLGFNRAAMTLSLNGDVPNTFAPNAMLYPLWTDLDPSAGGSVMIGTVGEAPHRVAVVSWVGVPHWRDPNGTSTFQTLLYEGRNDIVFQYLDVNAGNVTNGAGRSATVGIEDASGSIARKYSFNGSAPLTNGQAIAFTMSNAAPPLPPPPLPATPELSLVGPLTTNQITASWSAAVDADAYILFREGLAILTTTNTMYADIGLLPGKTYCYAVIATNRAGSSPPSPTVCDTTLSVPTFVMDGNLDSSGYLQRADGLTLYAALRGQTLYLATRSPGTNATYDLILFVATDLYGYGQTPFDKAGWVGFNPCGLKLAVVNANRSAGWYSCDWENPEAYIPVAMSAGTDGVMEGTIDIYSLYGSFPPTFYVAVAAYEQGPGGRLIAQTPPGNGDGNLDTDEMLAIPLASILDDNQDGVYDDLEPP